MSSQPVNVTAANFDNEVVKAATPVIVDFWAPWCGPCRSIGPILNELALKYEGKVKVAKVNVDEEQGLAQAFQVRGIPTLAVVSGGEIQDVQVGFGGRAKLEQMFTDLAGQA